MKLKVGQVANRGRLEVLKKKAEQLEFEAWPDFRNFRMWRMNVRSEVASGASRSTEAIIWTGKNGVR